MSEVKKIDERTRKLFSEVVQSLAGNLPVLSLSHVTTVLNPRLTSGTYSVVPIHYDFVSLHTAAGRTALMTPGVVLATVAPGVRRSEASDVHCVQTHLQVRKHSLSFLPAIEQNHALPENEITSFAHVILLQQGRKLVVLVPCLQKVTSMSKTEGRPVDTFVGSQGPDRHLIHLSLAQRIVDHFNANGVRAELHVPAPANFKFHEGKAITERAVVPKVSFWVTNFSRFNE